MPKPEINEVIVVEGRYDKNALSQAVDAIIIETSGFGVFSDREKLALLRSLADKRGLVILTDSDGAGFLIRNFLRGAVTGKKVMHAYIPEVEGKERRKKSGSREGMLGVEGMPPAVLIDALRRAGATFRSEKDEPAEKDPVTKADLYEWGLSGGENSAVMRRALLKKLRLPRKLSSNALIEVLNALYDRKELAGIISQACPPDKRSL